MVLARILLFPVMEKRNLETRHTKKAVEGAFCPSDAYYSLIPYARDMERILAGEYKDIRPQMYEIGASAHEYRYDNGSLRMWNYEAIGKG